jgi:hypothetical protein
MRIMVTSDKFAEASAFAGPFIEVTHKDGRHFGGSGINLIQDGSHLLATAQTRQVEVHAHDP